MFATVVRLSKASRAPLTPKRGNKDFYKGTRQAFLPGGRRTGAPGKHVIRGKAKYRLVDEQVRVYVAPPLDIINNSELKPYVSLSAKMSPEHETAVFSKFRGAKGLSPQHFLRVAREHTQAAQDPQSFTTLPVERQPVWIKSQVKLGIFNKENPTGIALKQDGTVGLGNGSPGGGSSSGRQQPEKVKHVRELEVVSS